MMACIGWTWEREVRLRFHPLQMGEMAHGRLAFSWPACTGCLPLSESIEISSLHQLAGLKREASAGIENVVGGPSSRYRLRAESERSAGHAVASSVVR